MRKTKDERRKTKVFSGLKARLQALHRDEGGAIAILVLLTIWCLVAILGLVWNTAEESYRRERMQTAADAAAHGASTWVSRTLNTVDAQNMVISQDASTEVIWRAVPPTDQGLMGRLTGELARAQQMKAQGGLQQVIRQLALRLQNVATERQLMTDALVTIEMGDGANYADQNEGLRYLNQYRQAESARDWVYNTYVMGVPPPVVDPLAPPRPGPPGPPTADKPNGSGLADIIVAWQPPMNEDAILDYIINFIQTTEMPIVQAFEARTAPATALPMDELMAAHEAEAYQNELAQVENLALTIEQQRQELAAFYQTDVTLATLKRLPGSPGSAAVTAPLMPAALAVPVMGYTDSIRTMYPVEAAAANLSPVIDIDAINVHVNPRDNTDPTQNAIIWHPNIGAPVPDALRAQYPSLRESYMVNASFPDGWGHIWVMPLEHYVHQRVNADSAGLNTDFMAPLDQSRTQDLARAIRTMLGLPNNGNINIQDLPGTLPDDRAEPNIPPLKPGDPIPPPQYDRINVMPRITAPTNATAAFRAQVQLYNQHGGAYTAAVRSLRSALISYTAYFNRFTEGFAQDTWQTHVNLNCTLVLENLGKTKGFMVLSTYGLRPIPEWARGGMFDSATATIENQIMTINIQQIASAVVRDLQSTDPRGLGGGILDQQTRNGVLYSGYIGQATGIADAILRPAAHEIALRLAGEWVNRPWPYEITPPDLPVPPFRGIGPGERKREYTVLAGSRQTDASAPHLLLPTIFGTDATRLVAYGQGETFNWMEFNASYGGGERFDEVVFVPEVTYRTGRDTRFHAFVGSPRGWRVDSIGGWNWRTRLSLSDGLYEALLVNAELGEYLQESGITNLDQGALHEVNLH